jgi:putative acetyltransferase
MVTIRVERPSDIPEIQRLNEAAFDGPAEASIVDALRKACPDSISLVATDGDSIVGHIFFSPASISRETGTLVGMGLAPMAVVRERRRQGIGSQLVRAGIEELRTRSCPFVIVVGHPEFYPRFGFEPASRHGLQCQWPEVPNEAFMVLILDEEAMEGVSGIASYRPEFDQAM